MSNKFFSNNFDTSDSSSESNDDSDNEISEIKSKITKAKKQYTPVQENSSSEESEQESTNSENSDENNFEKNKEINNNDSLQNLNKLITLRYIKDGKASRTYIDGLELFFDNDNTLNKLLKDIQKRLSTGYFKNKETNNHGFNGDHRLNISKLLTNNYDIPKNKIKVC
jgi:translation initiation factor 1 (eIF-1/SUI1)